jgi:hypothetical protein
VKYAFITGDSYCLYRNNPEKHWPARVAEKLKLELLGEGYAGQGWWESRLDFVDKFINNRDKYFDQTLVFIFVHTSPLRPITAQKVHTDSEAYKFYVRHYLDEDVNYWCTTNWYKEINEHTKGKIVIHLHAFETTTNIGKMLEGTTLMPTLVDLSTVDHGGAVNKIRDDKILDAMNASENHLTIGGNCQLADKILGVIEETNGV